MEAVDILGQFWATTTNEAPKEMLRYVTEYRKKWDDINHYCTIENDKK